MRADAVGRAVDVRLLPKSKRSSVGFEIKWPKSHSTGLVRMPDAPLWAFILILIGAIAAAIFVLVRLASTGPSESDWIPQVITALTVMASIVIAAAFTVASRVAVDHGGPWAARRDILTRATGLAALGMIVLAAAFTAAFLPFVWVRYFSFAFSAVWIPFILLELVQTPRRLTMYATEARRAEMTR